MFTNRLTDLNNISTIHSDQYMQVFHQIHIHTSDKMMTRHSFFLSILLIVIFISLSMIYWANGLLLVSLKNGRALSNTSFHWTRRVPLPPLHFLQPKYKHIAAQSQSIDTHASLNLAIFHFPSLLQ